MIKGIRFFGQTFPFQLNSLMKQRGYLNRQKSVRFDFLMKWGRGDKKLQIMDFSIEVAPKLTNQKTFKESSLQLWVLPTIKFDQLFFGQACLNNVSIATSVSRHTSISHLLQILVRATATRWEARVHVLQVCKKFHTLRGRQRNYCFFDSQSELLLIAY